MATIFDSLNRPDFVGAFGRGMQLGDSIRQAGYVKQLRSAIDADPNLSDTDKAYLRANPSEYGSYAARRDSVVEKGVPAWQVAMDLRSEAAKMVPVANDAARRYRASALALADAKEQGEIERITEDLNQAISDYNEATNVVFRVAGLSNQVQELTPADELAAKKALDSARIKMAGINIEQAPKKMSIAEENLQLAKAREARAAKQLEEGTEGEKKAAGLYATAQVASADIAPITPQEAMQLRGFGATVADMIAGAKRASGSLSKEANAAVTWADNALRTESGAAIGVLESGNFIANYIPVQGESEDKMASKARLRAAKNYGLKVAAGKLAADAEAKAKEIVGGQPLVNALKVGTRKKNAQGIEVEYTASGWKVVR